MALRIELLQRYRATFFGARAKAERAYNVSKHSDICDYEQECC